MVLPRKGTMQPVKKVLGALSLIIGLCIIFTQDTFVQKLSEYELAPLALGVVVAVNGYFLFISGRQNKQ